MRLIRTDRGQEFADVKKVSFDPGRRPLKRPRVAG